MYKILIVDDEMVLSLIYYTIRCQKTHFINNHGSMFFI